MSEIIQNDLRCTAPQLSGVRQDSTGIYFLDGSGYNAVTNTVTASSDATFKLYRARTGWKRLFGKWECFANIKNGNGTIFDASFRQIS